MATWSDFATADPRLAAEIKNLIHQYGPGLAYLATVRADGGPRIHPVSPIITDAGAYCFVMRSPKQHDLTRDGRYALHAYPAEGSDDEAYISGRARLVTDPRQRERLANSYRAASHLDWRLFELGIEVALLTRYRSAHHPPRRSVWHAPALTPALTPAPAPAPPAPAPHRTFGVLVPSSGMTSPENPALTTCGPARVRDLA